MEKPPTNLLDTKFGRLSMGNWLTMALALVAIGVSSDIWSNAHPIENTVTITLPDKPQKIKKTLLDERKVLGSDLYAGVASGYLALLDCRSRVLGGTTKEINPTGKNKDRK